MEKMQLRNSRLPTITLWVLVGLLCIVSYKYWILNTKYVSSLNDFDMRIGEFELKKASLETDYKTCKDQHDNLNSKHTECQTNFNNYKSDNEVRLVNICRYKKYSHMTKENNIDFCYTHKI
jgi:hypothetical protein